MKGSDHMGLRAVVLLNVTHLSKAMIVMYIVLWRSYHAGIRTRMEWQIGLLRCLKESGPTDLSLWKWLHNSGQPHISEQVFPSLPEATFPK
jgi:hypothetical protein